jgi:hypothetical protein
MSRRWKSAAYALTGLVVAVAILGFAALRALRQPQPFYAKAMRAEPQELQNASKRLETRVSDLRRDAERPGRWQTVFTDDEVNGWLAVVLKEKYTDLLPPEVVDPRVAFDKGAARVGYRYQGDQVDALISIEAEASMASDDVASVRFKRVRAGSLPLPTSSVVEYIDDAAKKLEIPARWTETDGDPTLLVPVAGALSTEAERRRLETIELHDGKLVLEGSTQPLQKAPAEAPAGELISASR